MSTVQSWVMSSGCGVTIASAERMSAENRRRPIDHPDPRSGPKGSIDGSCPSTTHWESNTSCQRDFVCCDTHHATSELKGAGFG